MLRRLAGFFLRKVQRISIYRWVGRLLRSGIAIREANKEDLVRAHTWLSSGDPEVSVTHNSRATNFVAKKGGRIKRGGTMFERI